MELKSGAKLGPYEILSQLGAGGMGEVYKARDTRLGRAVAIKVMPKYIAAREDLRARFEREARAVSSLNHPNICVLYDIGKQDGIDFMVLEYLEGETLAALIAKGPLPLCQALKYATQIADALDRAHRKGVVHRDVKPANIMITREGVKVLDFGLAGLPDATPQMADATVTLLTRPGAVMGTLPFMSPEQVLGGLTDGRSDLFSFGVVLYGMATGQLPFQADNAAKIAEAILRKDPIPASRVNPEVPPRLQRIIGKCLEKEPVNRYQTAGELCEDLRSLATAQADTAATRRRPLTSAVAVVGIAVLLAGGGWMFRRNQQIRWATQTALPQALQFAEKEDYFAAYGLAGQAEPFVPDDPILTRLWPRISRFVTIETTPAGAEVYRKPYSDVKAQWTYLGRTPIRNLRIARGYSRWKIGKTGYETIEAGDNLAYFGPVAPPAIETLKWSLVKPGEAAAGMVRVGGGITSLRIPGLEGIPPLTIPDYWIDRYEVSNRRFREFVRQGGYQKPEFWKVDFTQNGHVMTWKDAVAMFQDKTGKPGPAGWEFGDYPAGQDDYPVNGVSWYEAAAFAEFAHRSLPTAYQWSRAAGTQFSAWIVPASNFGGQGLTPRGATQAVSPSGLYDTAGNVKEWCWNSSGGGRLILGGGYNEPAYMFNDWDAKPPMEREANYGFRLVKAIAGAEAPVAPSAPIPTAFRDYLREKPVSDAVFAIYRSVYSYDRTTLNPTIDKVQETAEWRRESISYRAGYGEERMSADVFIPKTGKVPYQTVVFFPGAGAIHASSQDADLFDLPRFSYLIRSGRALIFPVYKGTFERRDELRSDHPTTSGLYRDHVIMWSKELRRTLDYIETRRDLDAGKIAYYGLSWGATLGATLPALDDRIKVLVLESGGLYSEKTLPEVDQINFAPRVKAPVLMVNAHYDHFFPLETSQLPMLHFFGAADKDKRHVVVESWHVVPRYTAVKEGLAWLDRYLGPVAP